MAGARGRVPLIAARRIRPRGAVRHYAGFLTPGAVTGLGVAFERNGSQRVRRLGSALGDRVSRHRSGARPMMRALQAGTGMRLRFRDVPVPPEPGPHGAIVHPIACSTCDLDCGIAHGATQFALPLHLGHECVAEVLTVGEGVRSVRPGDRVIVPFQISCGMCTPCRAGHTGSCTSLPPVSMYGMGLLAGHWGGAFSDQLAVPYAEAMLVALPAGIDPVAAAGLADNVCDAYRHIAPHLPQLLAQDAEAEVLILGSMRSRSVFGASVSMYAGLIARALGAKNVCLADARPPIRAHAEKLGLATLRPSELRRRAPAPLVIDTTISHLGLALANTAADGVCTSSGSLHPSARIPLLQMYARNVTLHVGRTHVRPLIPRVLELIEAKKLDLDGVPTTTGSLDEAPRLLREHFLGGGLKAVLTA